MTDKHNPPKDIRVDMSFRNNFILAMMERSGIKTVAELERATGISQSTLGLFINMSQLPTRKDGQWRKPVVELADFFKCLPGDLFSEFQQDNILETNRASSEMHFAEIQAMLASQNARLLEPDAVAEAHELSAILEQAINRLKPKLQVILRGRFGFDGKELTQGELAKSLGVSRSQIAKMENEALCSLRKVPWRIELIAEAAGLDS